MIILADVHLTFNRKHSTIRELYYITHVDNVPSIMKRGILSHKKVLTENIDYTKIYNEEIVSNRKKIDVGDGRNLWDFTNLYFNVRNPMLYKVICDRPVENIAVIGVPRNVLNLPGVLVSDGNAASSYSTMCTPNRTILSRIAKQTDRRWWNMFDGSKRKIMAECLVPDSVPPDHIRSIYFSSFDMLEKTRNEIRSVAHRSGLTYAFQPDLFFQPTRKSIITNLLSVVEGDMFFSRFQTLAVSVNCVGVMGKGVASRTKEMFPDVYVHYQLVCRRKSLRLGKPYLYRPEISADQQLADEPQTLSDSNGGTYFLLFATKQHWRMRADIDGIERGLRWICDNYKKQGIQSLAVPALGCGLGRLDWSDVGPILCKYLTSLDIPVNVYLPLEKQIADELISKDFLLG